MRLRLRRISLWLKQATVKISECGRSTSKKHYCLNEHPNGAYDA